MMASSGRAVLALLDASQIPAVSSATALAGLGAGFMAAIAYAGRRDAVAKMRFTLAVLAARQHPDYEYSREFLAGVVLVLPELEALHLIGGQS